VPVAAAWRADVSATDPDPRVALRGGEHVGEQLPVRLLDESALGEGAVALGEAGRERVADLLQLAEVEDARRPGGVDPVGNVDPAHALGDESADLQLELGDLPAQLGARPRLVKRDASSFCRPLGDKRKAVDLDLTPVEQIRHGQILSRPEGRGGNP
jgi:hypothetical protein